MYRYEKIRLWEVRFQVDRALESFPVPHEIVLERQTSPRYYIAERLRPAGEFSQIVCTVSGEGAFRYGDTVYPLLPGTVFLAAHGDPLVSYYYPGHGEKPWEFLWLSLRGKTALQMLNDLISAYGRILHVPEDAGYVRYLQSFRNGRRSLRFVTPAEGAKIVLDAMTLLTVSPARAAEDTPASQMVRAAQTMITEGLEQTFRLQEVADRLHVSREHLSRVFREHTGVTLQDFVQEERMQFAARMLRDAFSPVNAAAERAGYMDAASFSRAFRRRFGCTPTQYRRRFDRKQPR